MNTRTTSGFALPLVLAVVALVSVSVLALAQVARLRGADAMAMRAHLAAELAATSAEARVSHLLATEPLGARAIMVTEVGAESPVVLDGRAYRLPTTEKSELRVIVRLQDEAGLVNLNRTDTVATERLLKLLGADAQTGARLAGVLADFIDEDDLRRQDGAERDEYARKGLPSPRNGLLEDHRQTLDALGWANGLPSSQAQRVMEESAALSMDAPINPNTATRAALESVFGIDASAAADLIAAREEQSLSSLDDVMARTGAPDFQSQLRASPARSARLTVRVDARSSQESYVYASRIAIAEEDADRPIIVRRYEAPMRAGRRERARGDAEGALDTLPESARLRSP